MKHTLYCIALLLTGLYLSAQAPSYELSDFRCSEIMSKRIFESGFDSEYLLAYNDSTLIALPSKNKFVLSKKELENEFMRDFNYIYYTDDGTFLVHSGGGVVLLYDGQNLTRVDDSFYHQNQYGAQSFEYNNQLYLFAGQGLFTSKNILTKYDSEVKEWILVSQSGKIPEFNPQAISARVADKLFLLTYQEVPAEISHLPMLVYVLDLNEMHWDLVGQVSLDFSREIGFELRKIFLDSIHNKLLLQSDKGRFIIDFEQNTFAKIKTNYPLNHAVLFNHNNGQDLIAFYCDNKTKLENQIISKKDYYSMTQSPKKLYEKNLELYYSVIFNFFISGLALFILYILSRELKLDSRIIVRMRNRSFIYKLRRLKIFDQQEINFLVHLAEFGQITFQDLEDIISSDNDSSVTRSKNREKFLRSLTSKLMGVFNIEHAQEANLILVRANPQDKRLKYYVLNYEYFKIM